MKEILMKSSMKINMAGKLNVELASASIRHDTQACSECGGYSRPPY
jgi:hypothetical protein